MTEHLKWLDFVVIGLSFGLMLYCGVKCSSKNKSSEDYFMGGRKMPGWMVGFSILATMISSIGFIAVPGFAYKENWRFLAQYISFVIPLIIAIFVFIPFYRKNNLSTAYEFLEKRYGAWARFYTSGILVINQLFFVGTVLYMVCLPIQVATGWNLYLIIVIFAIIVAFYTVLGGLEAVIWTDVIQGIALFLGAIITVPIICHYLPGGFSQIIEQARLDNKMSLGSLEPTFVGKNFWVMFITGMAGYLVVYSTNQTYIQRYAAPANIYQARKAMLMGSFCYLPIMFYFLLIGTSLYVYYKQFPSEAIASLKPEQIFPYFILTKVPTGFAGLIFVGLLAAAMSTLDSILNACASMITFDFYRRLVKPNASETHYLNFGKLATLILSFLMIFTAILMSCNNQGTILDALFLMGIFSAIGIFPMFMLGFFTTKVHSKAMAIGLCTEILIAAVWLFLHSDVGRNILPVAALRLPDLFWLGIICDTIVMILTYFISCILRDKNPKNLTGITIWTTK